jgi:hypothetical protein
MKNSRLLTAYLDECAVRRTMGRSDDLAVLEERVLVDYAGDLYRQLLDDGWTVVELDAAFERRFGVKVVRE